MKSQIEGGFYPTGLIDCIPGEWRRASIITINPRELRREKARRSQPKQRIAKPHVEGFA